jgi:hypothetical protein
MVIASDYEPKTTKPLTTAYLNALQYFLQVMLQTGATRYGQFLR